MSLIQPRPYQIEATDKSIHSWQDGVTRQLIVLPTGCHAKGTPILMYDGTIRNVEDIVVGDLLIGPDSQPRTVLSLVRGRGCMYRISPIKGDPFVVNGDHILSLKRVEADYVGEDIVNISVTDYLNSPDEFKNAYKLYRVPVEFKELSVKADPYRVGFLSASGTSIEYCYKANSRTIRLNVLAGLLDAHGSIYADRYEFSTISKQLVDDVLFLVRSLGFEARVTTIRRIVNQLYYYVLIYGNCSIIPTRLLNKQTLNCRYCYDDAVLVTSFQVTALEQDDYYGFQIDADNLYLMGDFTVTHNCGKTIIMGMVAETLRMRTLVLAHREELLVQAVQKMHLMCPEASIGIFQAQERRGLGADICIASVQTAVRHIEELRRCNFDLCICDEAHHAVANSYLSIFKELGFLSNDPNKLLLGVTATAFRADKYGLADVFQAIVFERTLLAMIRAGYLCNLRGLEIKTNTNISSVATRGDDFVVNELASCVDTPERNALVVDAYLKHGENRHGVVFGTTVAHALNLAEMFKAHGVACEAVYGEMDGKQRRRILQMYANHEIDVISNVGVLTEGWDSPDTDCVMMARPTKSRGLFIQCVGRSLRPFPGKQDSLLLDFVDVASRHDICNFGTLAGKSKLKVTEEGVLIDGEEDKELSPANDEFGDEFIDASANTGMSRISLQEIKASSYEANELSFFARSKYKWQLDSRGLSDMDKCYYLAFLDGSCLWCFNSPKDGGYLAVYVSTVGKISLLSELALPLDYATGVCEDYIRKRNVASAAHSEKDAHWRDLPITDKQIDALRRSNIQSSVPYSELTRGEASDLLENKFGSMLATPKQIKFLRVNNVDNTIPELLTRQVAKKLIDAYVKKSNNEYQNERDMQQYQQDSESWLDSYRGDMNPWG